MFTPRACRSVTAAAVFGLAAAASADTVKLREKPAFRNVKVTDFRRGRLVFRGVSRQYLRKPLEQIEWVAIDGLTALSSAEQRVALGRWQEAIGHYETALDTASRPWQRNFILIRLIAACDRGGEFATAIGHYIDLVQARPAVAARYRPRHPAATGSDENANARRKIELAIESGRSTTAREVLRTFLLELMIYERNPRVVLLFPPPKPNALIRIRPATLPQDSFLLEAAGRELEGGEHARVVAVLEQALPYVRDEQAGPWRLLLARGRIAGGDVETALPDLMWLAERRSDRALAAEALYYLGWAYEESDRTEAAVGAYREVLKREEASAAIKARAEERLERIGE